MNHRLVCLVFDMDMLLVDLGNIHSKRQRPNLLCQTEFDHKLILIDHKIERFEIDEGKVKMAFGEEWNYDYCWNFIRDNEFEVFIERFELK